MILFINTHFKPDEHYGGVVYSGDGLLTSLHQLTKITGICVSKTPDKVMNHYSSENLKVKSYKSNFFHSLGFSFSLIFLLPKYIIRSDFIIINGIYTFPVTYAAFLSILIKKPFSVALRGGLEPWRLRQKKTKKRVFNFLFTNLILKKSAFIHAISEMEASSVPPKYANKTFVCFNGYDFRKIEEIKQEIIVQKKIEKNELGKDFLFLSRIDKEKGVDILLESFRELNNIFNTSRLYLVGPDNNSYLKKFNFYFENTEIFWVPGLYGKAKIEKFLSSDIFILPSYSENFGNVILEALALGIPVITTTGTPWYKIIPEVGCGWICEAEYSSLYSVLLKAATTDKSELEKMGQRGKLFVMKHFSWENIAHSFLQRVSLELIPKNEN